MRAPGTSRGAGLSHRSTDLPRVLSGWLPLKLRHLLDIAGVLGLHPEEFFRLAFDAPETPSSFQRRLDAMATRNRAVSREPGRGKLEEPRRRVDALEGEVSELRAAMPGGGGRNRGR